MSSQRLSEFFNGYVMKRLSAVEIDTDASNQHEFNGVLALRNLMGAEKLKFSAQFIYLSEQENDCETATAQLTWYDAREAHPTRTEYRLYFENNSVLEKANSGDILFIGKTPSEKFIVAIAPAGSSAENHLKWLFRLHDSVQESFQFQEQSQLQRVDISFVERQILEQLGIATFVHEGDLLNLILNKFGPSFPTTKIFSEFAREFVLDADPVNDPDNTLMQWMDQEEMIFRTLERHIVSEKLNEGFNQGVDEFISYSLGVQNRRKSRAGQAFENHIEQLLVKNQIQFTRGMTTEGKAKPDFIFPGKVAYADMTFPSPSLTMLAAKTSCKDRWRQILTEAKRIPKKHLASLEPGISEDQLLEMNESAVRLVIPRILHDSYTSAQQANLMDFRSLIEILKQKQANCPEIQGWLV